MNSWVLFVGLNFLLITIEAVAIAYIPGGFFPRRQSNAAFAISFMLLVCIANLVACFLPENTLIRIGCTLIADIIWVVFNFKASIIKCAFTAVLTCSLQCVNDNLFVLFVLRFSQNGGYLLNNPYGYYFFLYCSKLLLLLIAVLVRAWAKRRNQTQKAPWSDWLRVLFFPVATLAIALFLTNMILKFPELAGELLGCVIILLVVDLMSVFLINYLERQQNAILENAMLRQNLKIESEHILSLQESYANQRKQIHDFNNQLAVLRSMADHGAPQKEFEEYLNHILAIEFPAVTYLDTHRLVVDVILSQRCGIATRKGITLDLQLDDLSAFPLPDDALVVVLTNLIDNAIEACEKICPPSERRILLKMQTKPAAGILYIENTTSQPVRIHDNQIETTKPEPLAHGYGLKNICSTLDANHAMYVMAYRDDGIFCFSVRIPV